MALGIASSLGLHNEQFWIYHSLVALFGIQGKFDDAQARVERAKSHAGHSAYLLCRAAHLQAWLWNGQDRLEEAKSEALRAADLYEKIGVTGDMEATRGLLALIEEKMNGLAASNESDFDGELLGTALLPTVINFTF